MLLACEAEEVRGQHDESELCGISVCCVEVPAVLEKLAVLLAQHIVAKVTQKDILELG